MQELQTQILSRTKMLFSLASAIPKLPDGETKGELIYKHDKLLKKLNGLHIDLEQIDNACCYFGFSDLCSGMVCDDCPDFKQEKIYGG